MMFIGFSGAAFNKDTTIEVKPGSHFQIGSYHLRVADVTEGENDNHAWHRAVVEVTKNGASLGTLAPERRIYKARDGESTSEVAIRRRLNEDLYVNFAGMTDDGMRVVMQAYVFPLVSWIWLGYYVVLAGTLICLVPSKVRLAYARTQVVGVKQKYEPVQK
jgi:cytochrome c-type biogenesis protein CcmF